MKADSLLRYYLSEGVNAMHLRYYYKSLIVILLALFPFLAMGTVSTNVRFSDSNIPLELVDSNVPNIYREIMTGTSLSITIESDSAVEWDGLLLIEGASQGLCGLYGRGYDVYSYKGSILPAAGDPNAAFVGDFYPGEPNGLQFSTAYLFDTPPVQAGEWFIVDYNAFQIGDCNIAFYGLNQSYLYDIELKQVKTSDFDDSNSVDFKDFATLSYYWDSICTEPQWCGGADLDDNNIIDIIDLYLFSEHWLDISR
jgi:hypothetical protein